MSKIQKTAMEKDRSFGGRSGNVYHFPPKHTPKGNSITNEDDEKMDETTKLLFESLQADAREREKRISSQTKESEERIEKRAAELENRLIQLHSDTISKIEGKLDQNTKLLESKFETMDAKIMNIEKQVSEVHARTRFWVNLIVPAIVAIVVGIVSVLITS